MSVLAKIMALLTSRGGAGHGKRQYILDAAGLYSSGRGHVRLSPRDQVQLLQKLSRFAEREGIGVQAVFEGRPLREVENGGKFGPVTVYFAESSEDLDDRMVSLFQKTGRSSAVVVTSNPDVEKRVRESGGSTVRATTFRKGMDEGGGGGGGGGGQGGGQFHQRRRQRPRGGRGPRPNQDSDRPQQEQQGGNGAPSQQAPAGSDDPVRNLIDLVE